MACVVSHVSLAWQCGCDGRVRAHDRRLVRVRQKRKVRRDLLHLHVGRRPRLGRPHAAIGRAVARLRAAPPTVAATGPLAGLESYERICARLA